MSQVLVQEWKTIEDIAPQWFDRLVTGTRSNESLSIRYRESCIVGEAYNFKTYDCPDCQKFADSFVYLASTNNNSKWTPDELKSRTKCFENHWNSKHLS